MKEKTSLITAHSGSDATADNSMEFVRYALGTSADALEIDVRRDGDGGLIISHDETGEKAVTLKEVFCEVKKVPDMRMNCDLKEYGLEEEVYRLLQTCGLPGERILFSGSVRPWNIPEDAAWKQIEVYWNVEECIPDIYVCKEGEERNRITAETARYLADKCARYGISVININEKYLNQTLTDIMNEHQIGISAWTVNDPERIRRLLQLGVHNITTRKLANALKIREEREGAGEKSYDVMVIGPVSLDQNIDCRGNERREVGGAVVASGFAAAGSGVKTAIFCKFNPEDVNLSERFEGIHADLYWSLSKATCSIRNQYFTEDKEKRQCTSLGVCDAFRFEEVPRVRTDVYHFAGLVYGDFDGELLERAAQKGKVALDVQCMLRHVEADGSMGFHDWTEKEKYLPKIYYLKTDAAEAEIMTGLTDRAEAARRLYGMGAKEVLITHNTEVLAYDGKKIYTCPIKARNLSGRTGRGDTAFAGYIAARQEKSVEEALLYCTALVSLKMEMPGPFRGTKQDVLNYIHEFYRGEQ